VKDVAVVSGGGTNPAKNSRREGAQPHNKRVSIQSHF